MRLMWRSNAITTDIIILWGVLTVIYFMTMGEAVAATKEDLAVRWSPIIYQQNAGDSITSQYDTFTLINYDGDWRVDNNWGNLPFYPLVPAIYYSVVESDTHYYLGYYLYYPRHVEDEQRKHDLEGILISVVKKDSSLDMLFVYDKSHLRAWSGTELRYIGEHPLLSITSGTHKIKAVGRREKIPSVTLSECMWSYPNYKVVPLDELWQQRLGIFSEDRFSDGQLLFENFNNYNNDLPWFWQKYGFKWLSQPEELLQRVKGLKHSSANYLHNPYMSINSQ